MNEVKTLTVAAARYSSTNLGPIYACLLGAATARATDLGTALTAIEGPITTAITTLTAKQAELRAHKVLTAATAVKATDHQPEVGGTKTLTHSNARACKATIQPATTLTVECNLESQAKAAIDQLADKLSSIDELKVTKQEVIVPAKVTATADATNPSTQTLKSTAGGAFCIDMSDTGGSSAALSTASIAIRPLSLTYAYSPTNLKIADTAAATAPELPPNHIQLLTTDKALAAAFKAAQKAHASVTKLISEETSDILSSNRGCQAAAAAALEGKLLDSKTKTEINKLALNHLGGEGKNIGEQFFTKLKNDKIAIPTTSDPITGATKELAHSEHFQEVLSFFNAKNKMEQGGKTTEPSSEGSKESKKSEQEENKYGD
ncbi:hypothetical protein DPX39_030083700 [Trypanosoma brucei equiperdum]|uniref:Variant surface glycoprotein n=1 Tax=Trypanosoma brucei equiperdum TaxID=630700 RepID=A0A3L6L9Y6_9TRYP|nr:hypothetical protein DPX39_030078100 [Trypanosoma brucei equiperdum]RHW73606.1 hypothetical protein DPX39_030080900 [Trypanosoma brucei equiperdum]RHW73849.1 hypothetical protein DPX39_030075300 [Trypanosoma brucei equiperdum]RHW73871.1 hypothetical protein DPX39_030083700 [Trypanosoma brucei equiperdum]